MKMDPKFHEYAKDKVLTHVVRHVQSDSVIAVHENADAAGNDANDRNTRAMVSNLVARYDVQPFPMTPSTE